MAPSDDLLRKAAVLITLLDDQAVEALLAHMEREQVVRLQRVLSELAPAAASERSRVIEEFFQWGPVDAGAAGDSDGVEIDASLAARIASEEGPRVDEAPPDQMTSPFAFLAGVTPEVLSDLLVKEHAQTVSIVLSHLRPGVAAEVFQRLRSEQRAEVLRRLGRSREAEESVVAEVEQELLRVFQRQIPPAPESAAGYDADPPVAVPAVPRPVFEFDDLASLDDSSLARVFREAEPQAALVALAGAGPALADRIRRQLPWREARDLRLEIERLGPIRLSDVECAQQHLADVAGRLIQQEALAPPKNRRFVVAA